MEQVEQASFECRLAEEGADSRMAYALLMRALGLPTDTPADVSTREMLELGLAPSEVVDWLVACEYDEGCFRAEMFHQLAEARERRRAVSAMIWTGWLAVAAIGVGIYAWRKR
jgi:hypothetical protein